MHMTFALAIAIAANFWSGHGVQTPCHPQPVKVSAATMHGWYDDDGAITAAFAWPVACDIYLSPDALREQREDPAAFCADITHELGNINGVPETNDAGYVMSVMATDSSVPRDCRHYHRWWRQHWMVKPARERR